jgi:enediyne biosynthesis protein E4
MADEAPVAAASRGTSSQRHAFRFGLIVALGGVACLSAWNAFGQGVAVSSRRPVPGKPLPPGMTAPAVHYVDVAEKAGLTGVPVSGATARKNYIVETTGTGVAIVDYDNDGLPDILLVSGDRLEKGGEPAPRHYLYRNLGDLKFEDVTEAAGIRHTGWAQGVCAGDVDNDGHADVVITHWGSNVLYRNQGDGTFRDESAERGIARAERRWSTGCALLDYDRDGDLDLFVANYIEFDPAKTPKPGEGAQCQWRGIPVICGPRGLPGETMTLYENDGSGRFRDVSGKAGVAGPKNYYGFTPLLVDFDNDGWMDVYVACDSTASLLYHNQKDGTFEEIGVYSGAAYNEDGQEQAGMGVTAADYNGNGQLDLFKTNFSNDTHTLYKNNGDGTFIDETIVAGLAANTRFVGWGSAFLDFDHDGWKDLLVVNGHVYPEVDGTPLNETFRQPRLLYWNRGDGVFFDMSLQAGPGIEAEHSSRGLAIGDLNNDGRLEAVVVNMHERPSLLRNTAPVAGNSVLIRALTGSGRDAIGARLTLTANGRRQVDEVRSGGYHISQSDFRVHFGIGPAERAELEIRWPDGKVEKVGEIPANHRITIRQGRGVTARDALRRAE